MHRSGAKVTFFSIAEGELPPLCPPLLLIGLMFALTVIPLVAGMIVAISLQLERLSLLLDSYLITAAFVLAFGLLPIVLIYTFSMGYAISRVIAIIEVVLIAGLALVVSSSAAGPVAALVATTLTLWLVHGNDNQIYYRAISHGTEPPQDYLDRSMKTSAVIQSIARVLDSWQLVFEWLAIGMILSFVAIAFVR